MTEGFGSLSDAWEAHAPEWAEWTRVPGHDVYHECLNWPAFHALVPPAGRGTLDLGCGEGRAGRQLAADGHLMAGIDSSPTPVELAREAGGYEQLICADAAELPWDAQDFDLVVAYMSLHDMDDLARAIDEVASMLEAGAPFCVAIVQPLNRPHEALDDYFAVRRFAEDFERNGIRMTFEGIDRPLEAYTRALARAGFLIEELREPTPTPAALVAAPQLAKASKRPYFLHMRCALSSDH